MFYARYRQLEPQVPASVNTRACAKRQPLLMTVHAERRDDSVLQIVLQAPRCTGTS